jgi:hypothetical protein
MNYSRRQLEAFGETLGESVTRLKPGGRVYGGGGGGPSTTTVNQSNVPDWLRPQVENVLLGAGQQLFNTQRNEAGDLEITGTRSYVPYSANPSDYVANFSPLQQQAQANAANLQVPGQFQQGSQAAGAATFGSLGAGQNYANMATDPNSIQAYMSPYMQNVVDQQQQGAIRQSAIQGVQNQAQATQANAFGGSRQGLIEAERQRALGTQLGNIQAQGLQSAFQNAQQAQQFGAGLGLQGYGQALQGAGTMGSLGTQQLAAQSGILGLQNQFGGQQQQRQQDIINNAINNYAQAQQYPMQQFNQYNALLRGYAVPGQTVTQYQAQPTLANQIAGLGTAGVGALALNNALSR